MLFFLPILFFVLYLTFLYLFYFVLYQIYHKKHNTFYCWCVSLISFLFLRFNSDYCLMYTFGSKIVFGLFFFHTWLKTVNKIELYYFQGSFPSWICKNLNFFWGKFYNFPRKSFYLVFKEMLLCLEWSPFIYRFTEILELCIHQAQLPSNLTVYFYLLYCLLCRWLCCCFGPIGMKLREWFWS